MSGVKQPMGRRLKDLTEQKFTKLTVTSYAGVTKHGHIQWNTICECGNEKVIQGQNLTSGNTRSCGCTPKGRVVKEKIAKERKPREKKLKYNYPRRKVGHPPTPQAILDRVIELYNAGYSYREIQKEIKLSLRTISDTINENKDKLTRAQYTFYDNKRGKSND